MNAIYRPKGRALEYAPLAVNLYAGCVNGCFYCYVPGAVRKTKEAFHSAAGPRPGILEAIRRDAGNFKPHDGPVFLCFSCDPYPERNETTREAISILKENGFGIRILTKNPSRAYRDFDLMEGGAVEFGTTFTTLGTERARRWEPGADAPWDRIKAISAAQARGIKTWVSLEPVILIPESLDVLRSFVGERIVDFWRIGKWNHAKGKHENCWSAFLFKALKILENYGERYYIKDDLWAFAGETTRKRFEKEVF